MELRPKGGSAQVSQPSAPEGSLPMMGPGTMVKRVRLILMPGSEVSYSKVVSFGEALHEVDGLPAGAGA